MSAPRTENSERVDFIASRRYRSGFCSIPNHLLDAPKRFTYTANCLRTNTADRLKGN